MSTLRISIVAFSLSLLCLGSVTSSQAGFLVSSQFGTRNTFDAGVLTGGVAYRIRASGSISLGGGVPVYADGSLTALYPIGSFYSYGNPGATNYPTLFGGDGVNHFPGGGGNYDLTGAGFADAGKLTTDTTDPLAIRHGALVGTFASAPQRQDWFLIGLSRTIVVPGTSSRLYLAVLDTHNGSNSGSFTVTMEPVSAVPEPGSVALSGLGALGVAWLAHRRRGQTPTA